MSKAKNNRAAGNTVTLPRAEYERLLAKAGESVLDDGPAFPKPDARGNFSAVEYMRVSIARELIRRRRAADLTQEALAVLASTSQRNISKIESAKQTATKPLMERIERALEAKEASAARRKPVKRSASQKAA